MPHSLEALRHCILFQHLTTEEIKALLADIPHRVKTCKKNEIVFSPHHDLDDLGIILEGCVDVQKIFASGKALTVSRRYRYELIADAALFANITCYPSTVTACENSRIFFISKNNLLKLFTLNQTIETKFLECVSNRILALNSTIEILSLGSVPAKIAYFLIHEQRRQASNTIRLMFTKKALAERINVSRPALSKELHSMQNKGLVSVNKRIIQIHNLTSLEDLCLPSH
jgi:CRP-like cAMP-binding protein